jgi:hypothetical protein
MSENVYLHDSLLTGFLLAEYSAPGFVLLNVSFSKLPKSNECGNRHRVFVPVSRFSDVFRLCLPAETPHSDVQARITGVGDVVDLQGSAGNPDVPGDDNPLDL